MTQSLDTHAHFLSLLLQAQKNQRKALLETLSHAQLDFIGDLFYNLVNNFPINTQEKRSLSKKKFVRILTDLKKSYRLRLNTVKKNKKQIEQILLKYKDNLLTLVK